MTVSAPKGRSGAVLGQFAFNCDMSSTYRAKVNRSAQPAVFLDRDDLVGARSFFAFTDFEFDRLAVFEGGKTAAVLDLGVVYEKVLAAIFRGDEAVALFGTEPLNGAFGHNFLLLNRN